MRAGAIREDGESRLESRLANPMHSPQAITQQSSRAVVVALLEQENLPATDLTDQHLKTFFFADLRMRRQE